MTETTHGTPWTDNELSRLDGWWKTTDRSDLLRVKPIGNGEVVLAALEWQSDEEGFAVFNFKAVFTHFGKYDFVFLRGRGFFTDYPGYCFARVLNCDDRSIVIAAATDKSFLNSVATKRLNGEVRVDKHSGQWAYVTAKSDKLIATLDAAGIDNFFNAADATAYTKVASGAKE